MLNRNSCSDFDPRSIGRPGMAMFNRTSSGAHSRPLKRTVLISHGENARRSGRIRREVALSGALRAERTPHFARSFLPSPEM
jgi:hypothetical protein